MSTNTETDSSSPEAALPGTAAVNSSLLEALTMSPSSVAADQEAVVARRGLSVEETGNTGTSDSYPGVGLSDSMSTSTSVTAPDESVKPESGLFQLTSSTPEGLGQLPTLSGFPHGVTTGTTGTTTSASLFGTGTGILGSAGPSSFDAFSATNEASAVTTPSDNAGQQLSFGQTGFGGVWSGGSVFGQNTVVRSSPSFGQSPTTTNSSEGRGRHSGHLEKDASTDKTYTTVFGWGRFGTSDDTRNFSLFGEGGPSTFDTVSQGGTEITGGFSDGSVRSVGFGVSQATQIPQGAGGLGAQPSFAESPLPVKPSSGVTTEFATPPSGTSTFGIQAQHGQPCFGETAQNGDGNDGKVDDVFRAQPVFSNPQAWLGYRHSSAATKEYEG